ncbi:MAG: GatB/YqeY domain-containing protein [Thermoanaerobaculia bacterium]
MTTPQQQIEQDLTAAMKAREKERVSTLRLLLTAIKNERIRLGEDVDEATFLHLVQKAIKQRQDSVEQYRQGNREDLATKEEREAEILAVYLPPPVGEDEIRTAIEEFVAAEGLVGIQGMGAVMKEMLARFSGRTDGGTVNRIARDILTETD